MIKIPIIKGIKSLFDPRKLNIHIHEVVDGGVCYDPRLDLRYIKSMYIVLPWYLLTDRLKSRYITNKIEKLNPTWIHHKGYIVVSHNKVMDNSSFFTIYNIVSTTNYKLIIDLNYDKI